MHVAALGDVMDILKMSLKASFVGQANFLPVREYYACMPRTKSVFVVMGVQCSISGTLVNDFCRCVKVMFSRFLARPLSPFISIDFLDFDSF